ncbi:hypothetical protein BIV57_07795 [Mangrovactinospora gilvigrisea]|uniref:ABC transporter n=1 Tax=Mangrovactinospora gilvigrisea TaxID=1428644 RepID=A0A1J7BH86_9ACTN|nr:hypothetical protein [Mangrovactinospora gilvigrisea]OIV38059.1 hypothetical protein BIV57_07795 [Mangrovactinospora gilvigrisea]
MTALVRYRLAVLLHSQRWLPPLFLNLVALAVLTSSDSGPLLSSYAVAAGAEFVCGVWLTAALVNAESPVGRAVTGVNAGGPERVWAGDALAGLAACAAPAVLGLGYPVVAGNHPSVTAAQLGVGALAMAGCACAAVSVGLLTSRPVIGRPGAAVLAAVAAVVLLLLVTWIPPVHETLTLLAAGRTAAGVGLPIAGLAAGGAVLLALCTLAASRRAGRG